MRLAEARVAAHKQAVYVLPARVACKEELAHRNPGDVLTELETSSQSGRASRDAAPSAVRVQTMPIPRTAYLRAGRPDRTPEQFITAERNLRSADFLLASCAQRCAERLGIEPQCHVGMKREPALTVDNDRVLAGGTQVASEPIQGDMEAIADNVGSGFRPEDAAERVRPARGDWSGRRPGDRRVEPGVLRLPAPRMTFSAGSPSYETCRNTYVRPACQAEIVSVRC